MKACPSEDVLRRLLSNGLNENQYRRMSQHVETCHTCRQVLDRITEPVAPEFETTTPDSTVGDQDEAVSQLMERLVSQGPTADDAAIPARDEALRFPGPPGENAPLGTLETYLIQEQVARGAGGLLFRAIDARLNRTVAIKVLHQHLSATASARARLDREARAIAALNHDHIVALHSSGTQPGFPPYLVMEYIDGEPLSHRLQRTGVVPPREAARVVREVALALDAAHQKGIIHRDVKPSNIMLDVVNGRAKITDFGLARDEQHSLRVTVDGEIAGTPAYMSPEQISEPNEIDGRSDIYSLGVVLYELLTGDVPFHGVVRATLMQILHDEPRPPRQLNDAIPADLETICLKAMAKQPAHRYASAAAMADDLQHWLENRPIQARPISAAGRFWRWCRRSPRVAALSAAVFLLLLVVAMGSTLAALLLAGANDKAHQAEQKANQNAQVATQQRDVALETLQALVFQAHDQLDGDVVDIDEIQKSLLDVALDGLRTVARSAKDKGTVDRSTVAAHNRLGVILMRLDRFPEAAEQFQEAQDILQRLTAEDATNAELQRAFVETEWNLGDLHSFEDDFDQAEAMYRSALQRCQKLAGRDSADYQDQRKLALAYDQLGDALSSQEDEQAAAQHLSALELWNTLTTDMAAEPQVAEGAMHCHACLSDIYQGQGQAAKVRYHTDEIIRLGRHSQTPASDSFPVLHMLYAAHETLAELDRDEGHLDRAIEHYEEAIGLATEIYDEFGSDEEDILDLANMQSQVAAIYSEQDKPDEAYDVFLDQNDLLVEFLSQEASATSALELIRCSLAMGETRIAADKASVAGVHFEQALQMASEEEFEDESGELTELTVRALMGLARAETRSGRLQSARDRLDRAVQLLDDLASQHSEPQQTALVARYRRQIDAITQEIDAGTR